MLYLQRIIEPDVRPYGQSGYSRPSGHCCFMAVMENKSILLQMWCVVQLLLPLGVQYVCREQHYFYTEHVYCTEHLWIAFTFTCTNFIQHLK